MRKVMGKPQCLRNAPRFILNFVGNAQLLKKLETVEKSLANNAKVVIPSNAELVNVIGELAGVTPIRK